MSTLRQNAIVATATLLTLVTSDTLPMRQENAAEIPSSQSHSVPVYDRPGVFDQVYMGPESVVYADSKTADSGACKPGVYRIPINNYRNDEHWATLLIGTPPQEFNIALDTGSANVWVPSSKCTSNYCRTHHQYDSSSSTTHKKNGSRFEIGYGFAGSGVAGFISQDVMKIGDLAWEMQDFAEATYAYGENEGPWKSDGTFGLAPDNTAVNFVVPPFYNWINQGLLAAPLFAFYFGNASAEGDESEVTFGGINHDHFVGDIVELPLRRADWEVELIAVTFGETVELVNTGASIDTGSSLITLPSSLAELMQRMGATRDPNGGYSIECEKRAHLPDMTFTLGGHNFSIGPEDYVFDYDGACISAFFGNDFPPPGGPFALIGTVFLRKWYSVFNVGTKTIGFAKAKQKST